MSKTGINGRQCGGRDSQFGAPLFTFSKHIASAAGTDFAICDPVPFPVRVVQVLVLCRAASALATVQLYHTAVGTPVSDAIAAVAANTYYAATTIDDVYAHFAAGTRMGIAVGVGAGTNDFDIFVLCVREDG